VQGFSRAISFCRSRSIPIFIDDAYGSRLRPVLQGQPKTCEFDIDLGITSCDKAGMLGPRAGLLVGAPTYVHQVVALASQLGLEARPPQAAAVLRALQRYTPEELEGEIALGKTLRKLLAERYGPDRVRQTGIGPSISEEHILEIAAERAGIQPEDSALVPVEASCSLGMFLLREWGVITVNAASQPGARVSLRLKPSPKELERFGGVDAVTDAIDKAFSLVAGILSDENAAREVILGERNLS
jgi:L-seryl-tRNA(Ser) seleniumtransferase